MHMVVKVDLVFDDGTVETATLASFKPNETDLSVGSLGLTLAPAQPPEAVDVLAIQRAPPCELCGALPKGFADQQRAGGTGGQPAREHAHSQAAADAMEQ